jgi:hypothetical protein
MRKFMLLVAAVAIAALPSTAHAAKKVRKQAVAAAPAQNVNPNEASGRFLRDAVPVILPTWALPFYLSQQHQGPHAYWYYNGEPRQPAQQVRKVRRAKHVKRQSHA